MGGGDLSGHDGLMYSRCLHGGQHGLQLADVDPMNGIGEGRDSSVGFMAEGDGHDPSDTATAC